jgi:hypothetical protein
MDTNGGKRDLASVSIAASGFCSAIAFLRRRYVRQIIDQAKRIVVVDVNSSNA